MFSIVLFSTFLVSSISSGTLLSFNQSSEIVCPEHTLVYTCITNGTGVSWRINNASRYLSSTYKTDQINSFVVTITDITNNTITSTATNVSASLDLNGTVVSCSGDNVNYNELTVHIAGVPVSVINIKIIPINNNTVLMNWYYEKNDEVHCIKEYKIKIISDDNIDVHRSFSNEIIIPSLIDTNYSFIIIPIDTIEREGPPSSLIQYIWNVPAQVVNISWDQISADGITIRWNNNEDVTLHYPPIHYIVSVHNITINTTDTNVTINGLYPNNEYTVCIKPVNIIGDGQLINITVNITDQQSISIATTLTVTDSLSEAITTSNDRSTLTSILFSTIDNTLVSETSSSIEPSATPSNSGTMILSLLFSIFGAIGAIIITSVIAVIVILVCIMYRRKCNSVKKKERNTDDYTEVKLQPTGLESYAISTAGGQSIESQYSVIRKGNMMEYEEVPPPIPPAYNYNENGQSPMYSTVNKNQVNDDRQRPVYSTVNKHQVPVESANKVLLYADVMIVPKDSRPQCPPTSIQPVTYAVI